MDKYIFPAALELCNEGGYCITFPDLPGIVTSGDTIEEALYMAKDALELHIYGMESEGDNIQKVDLLISLRYGCCPFVMKWQTELSKKR